MGFSAYCLVNKSFVLAILFLIIIGIGVSRVKYEVVFLRRHFDNLKKEIETCEDDLKVLGAEWSYLNNPKRLKALAAKHLPNMKPIENKQIISYERVLESDLAEREVEATSDPFHSLIDKILTLERERQGG
ncbi:hypothetical protein FACS1894113_2550 [Alphaproteobacteria bacterium]|nr:hypothetical protein FACS1894113_2550 [Alphaproteobacteria bacterium]